jgi:hypothetical protein
MARIRRGPKPISPIDAQIADFSITGQKFCNDVLRAKRMVEKTLQTYRQHSSGIARDAARRPPWTT